MIKDIYIYIFISEDITYLKVKIGSDNYMGSILPSWSALSANDLYLDGPIGHIFKVKR